MALRWIAQKLDMGSRTYVSNLLVVNQSDPQTIKVYDRPIV